MGGISDTLHCDIIHCTTRPRRQLAGRWLCDHHYEEVSDRATQRLRAAQKQDDLRREAQRMGSAARVAAESQYIPLDFDDLPRKAPVLTLSDYALIERALRSYACVLMSSIENVDARNADALAQRFRDCIEGGDL